MGTNHESILKRWEPVIGLEVHVQLRTQTKMFCGCRVVYGDAANTHTCPTCLGLPGALPVANQEAIVLAIRLGTALQGKIRTQCRFARKNYFYPDLTKGYQISQYDEPLIEGGRVEFWWEGQEQAINLTRIHLEEDAGKSIHDAAHNETLLDYNRCGTPLIEIVSEPEFRHPRQARLYLERLKQVVRYLGISDASMEKGELRCDANISLRRTGSEKFGTRTEMKNMNSFRFVEKGLWYEIERQADMLDSGRDVEQCTLQWDEKTSRAEIMRTKEDAHDYRYFPDPDLVLLDVQNGLLEHARDVSLPHAEEKRLIADHGLGLEDAAILVSEQSLLEYFDTVTAENVEAKTAAKWIIGEVLRLMKSRQETVTELGLDARRLAELIRAVEEGLINTGTGKDILEKMCSDSRSPSEIIESEELAQVTDASEVEKVVDSIIDGHPPEVERYKKGEKQLLGFFMGQVMKATAGKSDPELVRKILGSKLG